LPEPLSLPDATRPEARLIHYRFARSKRRTIGLTIDASGLSVRAPYRVPWREIEAFLREKRHWIISRLDEWAALPPPPLIHGASGEALPLFGEPVALHVLDGRRGVGRNGARVVVSAPAPRRAGVVLELLLGWLKQQALAALAPRAAHFAARLGLAPPPVALSRARGQWGVCTERGAIRLNWRLVHLPPDLADYVVAHEVAHLVELNHSKRFWNLLGTLYPDWRDARERIELAGASLPQFWEPE
jgi:predicted metal-dependent hydrolase